MQNVPEAGTTYTSQADPSLSIYGEAVELIEADGDESGSFFVTGSPPKAATTWRLLATNSPKKNGKSIDLLFHLC